MFAAPTRITIVRSAASPGTSLDAVNVTLWSPLCALRGVHTNVALATLPSFWCRTAPWRHAGAPDSNGDVRSQRVGGKRNGNLCLRRHADDCAVMRRRRGPRSDDLLLRRNSRCGCEHADDCRCDDNDKTAPQCAYPGDHHFYAPRPKPGNHSSVALGNLLKVFLIDRDGRTELHQAGKTPDRGVRHPYAAV